MRVDFGCFAMVLQNKAPLLLLTRWFSAADWVLKCYTTTLMTS